VRERKPLKWLKCSTPPLGTTLIFNDFPAFLVATRGYFALPSVGVFARPRSRGMTQYHQFGLPTSLAHLVGCLHQSRELSC